MDEIDREFFVEASFRAARLLHGREDVVCTTCPENDPRVIENEHIAGRKHDDTTFPMCRNCHGKRNHSQRAQPPGGDNPRNPLEVIGRWLLGIAEYFELMMVTLRRFGEFLIDLARLGYGSDISFP